MALPKRTKKKTVRAAPRIKRGGKLADPSWEGWQEWDGKKYHRFAQATREFYYQNFKPADLFPFAWQWMEKNGYTKDQIKKAKAAPGYTLSVTASITAKLLLCGMPDYNPKEAEYWDSLPGTMGTTPPATKFLKERIERAINEGAKVVEEKKEVEKEKANVYVPSIQERIRDQAHKQSEAIEDWLEGWLIDPKSFDPKGFDFKKHFTDKGVTQAHARKLKTFYIDALVDYNELERMPTAGQLKKMSEFEADQWAQLKEGYAHIKKADIKNYRIAIGELISALDFVIDSAKATRKPRKPKVYSADKLVAKLKYCTTDEKYKLASISPDQIVGASELWVFNTKTRKIGKYIASNIDPKGMQRQGSGLSVKGTSIIGYDEKESIQKTLRKPDQQLKEFKDAGKVKLRKFLEDIKTTDTKLNGRCNPDTVLLKVV
tara:strand:- start:3926 stop:5218 length:1293 start_codon:yes stop_codon:yes gene_type:complete